MTTIAESLRAAAARLAHCSESPRLDAELLLARASGRTRTALVAHGAEELPAELADRFDLLLEERLDGIPVAYLTGTREFWSLPMRVTPAVLVPRPETETLVDLVLARLPSDRAWDIVDLGTGSGAIALAIAKERPRAHVTAVDVSPAALEIAAHNGRFLGIDNVDWHLGSWLEGLPEHAFDALVANPPYVADGDPALAGLRAEPRIALTPGPTGLEAFTAIAAAAPRHLREGALLAFEHGADQGGEVADVLRRHGFTGISLHADAAGRPRVTLATHSSSHKGLS